MNENIAAITCPSDARDLLPARPIPTVVEPYGLKPVSGWTLVPVDPTYRARNMRSARLGAVLVYEYLHLGSLSPRPGVDALDALGAVTDAVLAYVPAEVLHRAAQEAAGCCEDDAAAAEWLIDSAVGLTTALEASDLLTARQRPEMVELTRQANLRLRGLLDHLGVERLLGAVLVLAADLIPPARLVREHQGADGLRHPDGEYDPMDYWAPAR